MKQYIERQAAIGALKEETRNPYVVHGPQAYGAGIYGAQKIIERLPAADVVEVVRCKDCEQYVAGALGYGKCNFFKTAIFSEFYCRYGGKKGRPE